MIEILFFVSMFFTFYAYLGYPVSLELLKVINLNIVKKHPLNVSVTFIITVHNEEKRIKEKLENTVKLYYPKDKIEIFVASDGSYDRTNQIVKEYEPIGVRLLAIPERRGKEYAQKEAVKIARGEILVFSDVATRLSQEGLSQIVSNFADPTVGAVSGEDRLVGKDGGGTGEGLYVRYEMWLRRLETNVNSIVGLSGSFFAARREVCEDFSEEMQSDFRTVLNCIKMGYKAISDPLSIGFYEDVSDKTHEFERKVRTILRGLTVFFKNIEFLNFWKYGLFSYQYFCHKLLRWLVPLFLIIAFVSNLLILKDSSLYIVLFIFQLLFYGIGLSGFFRKSVNISRIEKVPIYFTAVNLAIIKAWWKFITGERIVLWTPSQR